MAAFYNYATLSYNGNVTNSNTVTGELLEALSAEKKAVVPTYRLSSDLVYIISITNTSNSPYSDVIVNDDLGAYELSGSTVLPLDYIDGSVLLYVNGIQQPAPAVTSGDELVISGIEVPPDSTASIIYAARVNRFAPLDADGSITNTAVIFGAGAADPVSSCAIGDGETVIVRTENGIAVSETVTAENRAELTITKSVCPSAVTEKGKVTYTFVIQNSGNAEVTDDDSAVVTDTFTPVLNITSVSYNGNEWTEGENYTYDTDTGIFTTAPGQITVPAAEFTADPENGTVTRPGVSILTVTGTLG